MKVLLFSPGTIGDSIVSLPAIRALKRHFGAEVRFDVLHERWSTLSYGPADVFAAVPEVERFISYRMESSRFWQLYEYAKLAVRLMPSAYTAVVNLAITTRPAKSIARDKIFFRSLGVRSVLGFNSFRQEELYPRDGQGFAAHVPPEFVSRLERLRKDGVAVDYPQDLATPLFSIPDQVQNSLEEWMKKVRLIRKENLIAFAPGTKQPSKEWSVENFIKLGVALRERFAAEIVIMGGVAEKDLGDSLLRAWGGGYNSCGELSVLETAAMLAKCSKFVGLDSGVMHIAGALGVPTVSLFSGKDYPGRWVPLGTTNKVIREPVSCDGCFHTICPIPGHPCMNRITVERVLHEMMPEVEQERLVEG